MARLQIDTAQNVALDVEVAGIGDRILAAMIDYAILGAYFLAGALVVGGLAAGEQLPDAALGVLSLGLMLPLIFYFLLCEVLMDGQSIGKRYMNVRVARLDGSAASLGDYLLRWLLRPIDVSLTSGMGAVATILVTGTGQRLGDLAAGTTVVRVRKKATLRDVGLAPRGNGAGGAHGETGDADAPPLLSGIERLTDADVATTREVLDALNHRSRTRDLETLGRRTQDALLAKMQTTTDLPPRAFLKRVVEDYQRRFG